MSFETLSTLNHFPLWSCVWWGTKRGSLSVETLINGLSDTLNICWYLMLRIDLILCSTHVNTFFSSNDKIALYVI